MMQTCKRVNIPNQKFCFCSSGQKKKKEICYIFLRVVATDDVKHFFIATFLVLRLRHRNLKRIKEPEINTKHICAMRNLNILHLRLILKRLNNFRICNISTYQQCTSVSHLNFHFHFHFQRNYAYAILRMCVEIVFFSNKNWAFCLLVSSHKRREKQQQANNFVMRFSGYFVYIKCLISSSSCVFLFKDGQKAIK